MITRDWIKDFLRWDFDELGQTAEPSKRLPKKVLVADIDSVQRQVSSECGLIPTCYHWQSVVGQREYLIERYPDLFVRAFNPRCSVYWKLAGCDPLTRDELYRRAGDYTSNGTPEFASANYDQRGTKWMISLLPAPDVAEGDGTWANDPIHFYCYRLPKSVDQTNGYLEVAGVLHDLVVVGTKAAVAEHLVLQGIEVPLRGEWKAEFEMKLAKNRVPEGIRDRERTRMHDVFGRGRYQEGALQWLGLYESAV